MNSKSRIPALVGGLIALVVVLILVAGGVGAYNRLVTLEQGVDAQWGQVESAYQRRADLVPNLVETVKGAANFERETLTQVIEARSRATQLSTNAGAPPEDPARFEAYQKAQDALSSSLSRLLVVVERYPELSATAQFRDLATQLEGTENRI